MAEPLEIKLTGHRRVLVDVAGELWRVAYYYPTDSALARNLERSSEAGSESARTELARIEMDRRTGKAPALVDALQMAGLALRESSEVSRYVLEYATK